MSDVTAIKVALFGDQEVGKTSFIKRYVYTEFTQLYVETIGLAWYSKEITVQGQKVEVQLWDIGGVQNFQTMIPLCASGAHAFLFLFDLSNIETLINLKTWFKNVHPFNEEAFTLVVGTKFDKFGALPAEQKTQTIELARKFAQKLEAPLIFTSSLSGININRCLKLTVAIIFGFPPGIQRQSDPEQPLLEYDEDEEGEDADEQ